MQCPIEVTFRDINRSEALETNVLAKVSKLSQFFDGIMSCHVVIETPHRHRQKHNQYHVRITLTVPERELVVNRSPANHESHSDAYVAIRDAFMAMRRQLEDYVQSHRKFDKPI